MKKKVPEIRFSGFDDEWEKKELNQIVERVIRKNKDNITNRPLTISAQYGLVDQAEFFNKIVASKNMEGYYLLYNGEFAYNKSYSNGYPFGAIKRLDKYVDGAVSTLYICFKNKKDIDSDYLVQYFETDKWHNEVSMIAVEGARNHGLLNISVTDFFNTVHRIPSLEEQKKIGAFLTKVDKLIEKQDEKVKNYELYKKGMMQKIFSQEIRFKGDRGKEYPEWEEKKLGDLGVFYRGHSYNSNDVSEAGLMVLRSNNIKNGVINYDELQFVKKNCKEDILLRDKDIVICMANGSKKLVGKAAEYKNKTKNNKVTVGAFCSIYRSENIIAKYLFQIQKYKKYLNVLLAGTNINNLKNNDLENLVFKIPANREEIMKIDNFITKIDSLIEMEKEKLKNFKNWKKGLLQGMLV